MYVFENRGLFLSTLLYSKKMSRITTKWVPCCARLCWSIVKKGLLPQMLAWYRVTVFWVLNFLSKYFLLCVSLQLSLILRTFQFFRNIFRLFPNSLCKGSFCRKIKCESVKMNMSRDCKIVPKYWLSLYCKQAASWQTNPELTKYTLGSS